MSTGVPASTQSNNAITSALRMQRYIYIHGSPDSTEIGKIGSHGCVRMRNNDIIELFELVKVGTTVLISE